MKRTLLILALALLAAPALLLGADDDARADARRDLEKVVRKIERIAPGPEPRPGALEALAAWSEARDAALDFILDEEAFAPAPGDWESPKADVAITLSTRAERAFAELERHLAREVDRGLRLRPDDARELATEHAAARARHEELSAALPAAEREPPAPPSDLALAVLAAAARDFEAAADRVGELEAGWPRVLGRYAVARALLDANRERPNPEGRRAPDLEPLNRYRMALGRMPVVRNDALVRAALGHSRAMREHGFFSHDSPIEGMETERDRARAEGYRGGVAEIIYAGSDLGKAMGVWKRSPSHHRTMLSDDFLEAGAGVDGPITVLFGSGGEGAPPRIPR